MLVIKPDLVNILVPNTIRNVVVSALSVVSVVVFIYVFNFEPGIFNSSTTTIVLILILAGFTSLFEATYYYNTFYVFNEDSLKVTNKLFSDTYEVNYKDIIDTEIERNKWDDYCNVGHIRLVTEDYELTVKAVVNPETVMEKL